MQAQTLDGRSLRILTLIDEHSRTCLALKVARRINSLGVIELWPMRCACTASGEHPLRQWPRDDSKALRKMGRQSWLTDPVYRARIPWENGYCESFNGKLRDECLCQEDLLLAEGGAGS